MTAGKQDPLLDLVFRHPERCWYRQSTDRCSNGL